ncbi:hypothetical protein ACFPM3_02205 [Streptomyces coeruleoprunus]|uniref:Secreted protein n=1 Tax=Streptomyces coeruleoprunus TaxID=285563 RepID=A0ABV9X9Y8_9ACTN
MATLLAALFICFGPARHAGALPAPAGAPVAGEAVFAGAATSAVSCPHDDRDCGLFPSLTPAVLTVPPLDPPPQADGLTAFATAPPPGRTGGPQDRPRAPDLHVLQVLRT